MIFCSRIVVLNDLGSANFFFTSCFLFNTFNKYQLCSVKTAKHKVYVICSMSISQAFGFQLTTPDTYMMIQSHISITFKQHLSEIVKKSYTCRFCSIYCYWWRFLFWYFEVCLNKTFLQWVAYLDIFLDRNLIANKNFDTIIIVLSKLVGVFMLI